MSSAATQRFTQREKQLLFLAGYVIDVVSLAKGGSTLTQQASTEFVEGAAALYKDVVTGSPVDQIGEQLLLSFEAMSKKYLAIPEGVGDDTLSLYFINVGMIVLAVSVSLPSPRG